MSLFNPIDLQARLNPDNLALAFESATDSLSYRELRRLIRGAAGLIERDAAAPNGRIGIHCQNPFLQIAFMVAASHLGINTIVVSPRGEFLPLDVIITDTTTPVQGTRLLQVEAQGVFQANGPAGQASSETNSFFVFVSPQPGDRTETVTIGERALIARMMTRALAAGGAYAGRILCVANSRTEIGFSAILESLWFGNAIAFSRGALDEDARSLALFDLTGVFLAASFLPNYFRKFEPKRSHGFHPSRILVAGSNADEALLVTMKRHICAHVAVHIDLPQVGSFAASAPWQVGNPRIYWPLPGTVVTVVGNDGRQLPANAPGTLIVKTDGAMSPAHGSPAGERFRDGWFITPLTGSFLPSGGFVLS
jgi:acyl-coenzyme A synthetase/AMP-(fatty) acid ligase